MLLLLPHFTSGETEAERLHSLPTQPGRGSIPLQDATKKWAEPVDILADAQERGHRPKPSHTPLPTWLTVSPEGQPSKKHQLPPAQLWSLPFVRLYCGSASLLSAAASGIFPGMALAQTPLPTPGRRRHYILLAFCASKNSVMSQ